MISISWRLDAASFKIQKEKTETPLAEFKVLKRRCHKISFMKKESENLKSFYTEICTINPLKAGHKVNF